MAGKLNLRFDDGNSASFGLGDAALEYLGIGPSATFDGDHFLVSAEGITIDSPNTDRAGRVRCVPAPVGGLTWGAWFSTFRSRINLDLRVSAIGGELARAAIDAWVARQDACLARERKGRPPKMATTWGPREEIINAIAIKSSTVKVLPAIRAVYDENARLFRRAFPGGTKRQRIEAAKRAYYRATKGKAP